MLPDALCGCSGEVVWGRDASAVVYTTLNDRHRCHEAWMHILGKH
jgi:protease II